MLGQAVAEALEIAEREKHPRFCRTILPGKDSADVNVAYVFLILAYPTQRNLRGGYDQYRTARVHMLYAYCLHTYSLNRGLKRVVGIAVDASSTVTGRQGGSEDILSVEIQNWTPELEGEVRELSKTFDVMRPERIKFKRVSTEEYPDLTRSMRPGLNRRQRRAHESVNRKTRAR